LLTRGGTAAVLVLILGAASELALVGRTDEAARDRAEREIRAHVEGIDASLTRAAQALVGLPDVRAGMTGEGPAVRGLFEVVRLTAQSVPDLSITVYDARGAPRAWSGRPVERRRDLIQGGHARFADAGPAGLRLVLIEPLADSTQTGPGAPPRRLGSVVVERLLSPAPVYRDPTPEFPLDTTVGRATIRVVPANSGGDPNGTGFLVSGADGRPLIAASIRLEEIAMTRARWRGRVLVFFLLVLAVTTALAGGRLLTNRGDRGYVRTCALLTAMSLLTGGWLWLAGAPGLFDLSLLSPATYRSVRWPSLIRSPVDLLLATALIAAVVALLADALNRWRWSARRGRAGGAEGPVWRAVWQIGTVVVVTLLLAGHHLILRDAADGATVDLLRTALQPFDTARVGLQLALVLSSAATVWAVSLALGTGLARWPVGLRRTHGWLVVPFGLLPVGLVIAVGWAPPVPSLLTTTLGLALALLWRRAVTWLRRTDLLARLLAVLCAVLLPALPLYVALVELTDIARHRLLEDRYAVQTIEHPEDLRRRLRLAQDQIDAIPDLRSLTGAPAGAEGGSLDTDRAFSIWRRTALAASRLTSAVELYGRDRSLSSRFALNIPEYGVTSPRWTGTGCDWEVFGEGAPLGSRERRMLHAERGLCEPGPDGTPVLAGAVVVHAAQVDYESLSFISPQSPYVELFQEAGRETRPDPRGHEIELVIYGWGLQPTFVSSRTAWAIDDALFQRIYASRDAFWTRLGKDDAVYDVLISNDRAGVYALGFPVHSALDHLLHLSEIAILVLAAFVLALVAIFVAGLILAGGRGGLPFREVRARFALKLQLWFVGVATVPVVVVAVLIQGYFAEQLRADVEAGAARTAAVARSVIEESVVLQPVDGQLITPFTDDVLVWISQIIGQDVHIFDGSQLVATSERDLYASGLLPTRTPDTVYRAIALERLPSFVGEDAIGALTYQLAAAPVRAGGRDAILTVPLASRQREIESEIDELNRRVWAFALFFAAIVGLIGWVIARSIAQPVKRLTRATSRVARGDFHVPTSASRADALRERVAAHSADELAVLESDFNKMAVELDVRRRQLERTHRLEAWSEMARQVAHEIKNPLTPVQLNAEHLRRVHADRGAPLSPVLEECVESILKQVRILRQIASEFSSYASSPVADRALTAVDELILDIIGPYRRGLSGRIDVRVDLPADLPELRLDRRLMQRALTNIVENALHAMPGNGTLLLGVTAHPDALDLVVTDTGVGLEADLLARIFEPYFSTKVSGTGLGMAIAKRNVELNGGTISVTSERGRGTTVTITLPVVTPPVDAP